MPVAPPSVVFGAIRSVSLALALACAAFGMGGCSSDDEASPAPVLSRDQLVHLTTPSHVAIEIRASAPIQIGENTFLVDFPAHGADLTSASAFMPAHGHGTLDPAIERNGDTFVIKNLVLFMSGRWQLTLNVHVDDRDEQALVAVDVP